jgi:hypothetical protein
LVKKEKIFLDIIEESGAPGRVRSPNITSRSLF